MDRRFHKAPWGNHDRVRAAVSTLRKPHRWQRKAVEEGVRRKVFVNHYGDVFDNQVPDEWRQDLWRIIAECPDLDWQLLTKRAPNIRKMLPEGWPWPHVWLGVTAGTQDGWDRTAVPFLRTIPAAVRFVSVEPMLEPLIVDLTGIDWVICGGERDPRRQGRARHMHPDWARSLRDQCFAAGVPFFMKQMTDRAPIPDDLMVRQFPAARRLPTV
jgi:protein gp37